MKNERIERERRERTLVIVVGVKVEKESKIERG
jgi:hypothetical protein